ncbi:RNA polymerase sigma-70 factor [Chryseotalea sanaruensis]|nr:RNA polymerase sigma-70 factor [Chryseotalea sanaruensis]
MTTMSQEALFKEIFETNYKKLCAVAYRVVKDQDESRDIVQQVMCEFWDNRNKWSGIQSYSAYLYTSVYRLAIHANKKFITLKSERLSYQAVNTGYLPTDSLSYIELEKQIAKVINELPPKCKEIFLLSREDELSYREIAANLNISVKTVEAQMGIALKRFRAIFNNTDQGSIIFFIFF